MLRSEDLCDPGICEDRPEGADPEYRCPKCPTALLESAMQSEAGALIRGAQDLDNELQAKLAIREEDVAADDFAVLNHLRFERARRRDELQEREKRERQGRA
jgi:hypothetical protein